MFPHHIKRENTDNTFLMEMPDILMLWVQILWDDRLRLPNVGIGTLKSLWEKAKINLIHVECKKVYKTHKLFLISFMDGLNMDNW